MVKLKKGRKGTSRFLMILTIFIIVVLISGFIMGGVKQLIILISVFAVVTLFSLLILRLSVYRSYNRLRAKVLNQKILWGAIAIIIDGDDLFEGEEKRHVSSPGPKGNLLLKEHTLSWIPDNSTVIKGYERTVWDVDKIRLTQVGTSHDITGISTEIWQLSTLYDNARLQIYAKTDSLQKFLLSES